MVFFYEIKKEKIIFYSHGVNITDICFDNKSYPHKVTYDVSKDKDEFIGTITFKDLLTGYKDIDTIRHFDLSKFIEWAILTTKLMSITYLISKIKKD